MTENNDDFSYEELQKLKLGTKNFETFVFPGTENFKVSVRVLSQDEITECVSRGRRRAQDKYFEPSPNDIMDCQIQYQILYSTLSAKDNETRFFPDINAVSSETADTLATLYGYYEQVQHNSSPIEELESEEDFEKMVESIKKNSARGMSLSIHTLRKLVIFMAQILETSPKDSGSTSTPSKASEETTKSEPLSEYEQKQEEETARVETKKL